MSDLTVINISIEIFCSLLSLVFIISSLVTEGFKNRLSRAFIFVLASNIAVMLSDATAFYSIGKTQPHNFVLNYLGNVGTFLFSYVLIAAFSWYLYLYFSTKQKTSKLPVYLIFGICLFASVLTIIALFNHMYFTIDQNNIYHRQSLYWLSQILGLIGMLINSLNIVRNRKLLNRVEYYSLISYIILPSLAIIVQTLIYGWVSVYIASTITIIIIYLGVQARQARIVKEQEKALVEVTEQRQRLDEANRQLDRINTMKSQFLSTVSHEMLTPLTVISANAQYAKSLLKETDSPLVGQQLNLIHDEATRLARLSRNVLELGILQEKERGFALIDLGELIEKTCEAYRSILAKADNQLVVDLAADLPKISGNSDLLIQVVTNLLSNSGRHTKNGIIKVTAVLKDQNINVTVKDNGEGIPPEIIRQAFDRNVKSEEKGGYGIGLAVCYDIIHEHGGEITIKSHQKIGTKVSFTLPVPPQGRSEDA